MEYIKFTAFIFFFQYHYIQKTMVIVFNKIAQKYIFIDEQSFFCCSYSINIKAEFILVVQCIHKC